MKIDYANHDDNGHDMMMMMVMMDHDRDDDRLLISITVPA